MSSLAVDPTRFKCWCLFVPPLFSLTHFSLQRWRERGVGWRETEGVCSPQLSGEDRTVFSCDSCALSSERCQFPEKHLEMRQDFTQYSEEHTDSLSGEYISRGSSLHPCSSAAACTGLETNVTHTGALACSGGGCIT